MPPYWVLVEGSVFLSSGGGGATFFMRWWRGQFFDHEVVEGPLSS